MKRLLLIMAILAAAVSCREKSGTDLLLARLDSVLEMKSSYEGKFNLMLDSFKKVSVSSGSLIQKYEINREIAAEYMYYSMDSAMVYMRRNLEIARSMQDRTREEETELMMARLYARAGYHPDAENLVLKYDGIIPRGLEHDYYDTRAKVFGELTTYTSIPQHWKERDRSLDSLEAYVPKGSFEHYDILFTKAMSVHDDSLCVHYLHKMLDSVSPEDRKYAWTTYFLSVYDSPESELGWLIKSSISDAMCATRDYGSLTLVARRLYEQGDYVRAFRYLADHCMQDAILYNGKLRPWQISQIFPDIEKKYEEVEKTRKKHLYLAMAIAMLLLLGTTYLAHSLWKRQRVVLAARAELEASKNDLESKNRELMESDKVKLEYLALYLGYLSENIGEKRHYRNHVLKHLKRGEAAYLVEEIESGHKSDDDIQGFYDMFDRTFVNLYPGFIDKFNALLADGEEIIPKGDSILTPELRVFALIKLGITDSSSIAKLLHYSVNTIYNYRAKVRNKARGDRDSFEDEVHRLA